MSVREGFGRGCGFAFGLLFAVILLAVGLKVASNYVKSCDACEGNGESLKVRQLEPVVCLPDGTIICGERRLHGAELAGMSDLEVKIIDDPLTEAEFRRLQFTENVLREDLTGHEKWQGCVELLRLNP